MIYGMHGSIRSSGYFLLQALRPLIYARMVSLEFNFVHDLFLTVPCHNMMRGNMPNGFGMLCLKN